MLYSLAPHSIAIVLVCNIEKRSYFAERSTVSGRTPPWSGNAAAAAVTTSRPASSTATRPTLMACTTTARRALPRTPSIGVSGCRPWRSARRSPRSASAARRPRRPLSSTRTSSCQMGSTATARYCTPTQFDMCPHNGCLHKSRLCVISDELWQHKISAN